MTTAEALEDNDDADDSADPPGVGCGSTAWTGFGASW
jgi:hypothetical protein